MWYRTGKLAFTRSIKTLSIFAMAITAVVFVSGSNIAGSYAEAAPARCKSGYVWREATSTDYICVRPSSRSKAIQDNRKHNSRVRAGSNRCKSGYVWREATGRSDKICVKPATRSRTARENAQHHARVRSGSSACPAGSARVRPGGPCVERESAGCRAGYIHVAGRGCFKDENDPHWDRPRSDGRRADHGRESGCLRIGRLELCGSRSR